MFTGIIEAIGEVRAIQGHGTDLRLRIGTGKLDLADVECGDSIATSGACLTVIERGADWYAADVSVESLQMTTLGDLVPGALVNLEKAVAVGDRLGGHMVSGHVDGIGEVVGRWPDGRSQRFRLRAPEQLARYIAGKGSITVDGVSLTVNRVDGAEFELNLIPVTLAETTLGEYQAGQRVNLEVDLVARYLERLLLGDKAAISGAGLSADFLAEHGYIGSSR